MSTLLSLMTREEKFWQLFMIPGDLDHAGDDYSHGIFGLQIRIPDSSADAARHHAEKINSIQRYFVEQTRLGIPILPFEEGLHGLGARNATVFPQAIGLAATWDSSMVARVAQATAEESRSRGVRDLLSPVINLATDVRWGRVEETYGEDPWLTSQLAIAFVGAVQRAGVIATPKHFVANVGDGGRDSYPINFNNRLLQELYFPPFKAAIDGGHAGSVMTAYNSVDGVPATQSRKLLTETLKHDWKFGGFVISDAAATGGATVLHMTEESTAFATRDALNAGLDVIFQSSYAQHRPYLAAFSRGLVADSVIDNAVRRVLRAKFALGLFEHPYVDADSAAMLSDNAAGRRLALDAARESLVLLKNGNDLLPFKNHPRSIAVIGSDAVEPRFGGYSGTPSAHVSILDGIRSAAGAATNVRYVAGPGRLSTEFATIPAASLTPDHSSANEHGLSGAYFANIDLSGTASLQRLDSQLAFGWTLSGPGRGIPLDWYSARWSGTFVVPAGLHRMGIEGNDGYRLYIDDTLVIDDWQKRSFGRRTVPVRLAAGTRHRIRVEYFETTGNGHVKLIWDAGVADDWHAKIAAAVAVARVSDVVVIAAGVEEGEFRDRSSLALPGHQEELIRAVAATGRPVVVVIVGGSAVTMSRWIDSVSAVVDAWYPGEAGGTAVADLLWGRYNPAGRLPITFPMSEGQLPLTYNHLPTGRGDDYLDLSGQPLFPFGFGLSFTTFAYSNLSLEPARISPDGTTIVHFRVTNTGKLAGDEVAQLYIRDELASTARPILQLEGFQRIHLAPGESRDVSFPLGALQLHMLDQDDHWIVEPGTFKVLIGGSSRDIRLRGDLTVQ